ncbi:MAG TPA: DUF4388 domain-containing protein [Thermoanaerobaculia bacterium]|nr:DUF4388 domain-containing protein [Thermoanaerobaculia bacterium]
MQFTREQLTDILRARSGKLEDTPYAVLLLALAVAEETAVLELRRNQLQKTVIFDDGSPVECRSNIATEMLSRFLVSAGKLKAADENTAASEAASRGVPIGEILTERKLLTPSELYRALQQNLGRKLLEPFSWTSGTWSISRDTPPIASVLRVKVPQLLVTGIQKVEPQETADAAAASMKGAFLTLAEKPLFRLDDVRLTATQQKVVDAARRAAKLDELRAAIDQDDLNRMLYALSILGVIETSAERRGGLQPAQDRLKPVPTFELENPFAAVIEPEPQPEPETRIKAASADEVISAYLSSRRKDAFDLLGVPEDAGPVAITKMYLFLSEKFLPSRFDEKAPDALREKAQEVFLAAARAYTELADPARRGALLKKREKLREEAAAAAKAGPSAMIDPEALFRSGQNLAAAGKLREALSSFELAAECDAQNGTYAAEAAWTRYRLGTPAANAMKMLKNVIRIDPNSGVAYLYAGQVQAALGHRVEASAYIDRAKSLMPGDPRPAEAIKALRL